MNTPSALPLNAGQEAAANGFFNFLFSADKAMGIDGPGGTGKSFLMANLIDVVLPRYFDMCKLMGIEPQFDEVDILAMTNKAAEVLAEATQRPVRTLHSFLGLKVVEDFTNGNTRVTKTNAWQVHQRKIIFIDEVSMMDAPTYNYLQEGTHGCKIVYVGDEKQLKPVIGTNPVYQENITWHTLTEQMRTGVPEIQALHNQLRLTVETGIFKPIQIVPGIIDHLSDDQMQAHLHQSFAQQTANSRILAYTNKRVIAYNDYVRHMRGLPTEYIVGEMLVNASAIRLRQTQLSVEAEVELTSLGQPYNVMIEHDVALVCRDATIVTRSGAILTNVPLPVDRAHFSALVAHYKSRKNWERYYFLKNNYPDLRQRDAATVYKAQGSTYDTGFVDLGDISQCHNPDQVARMLYVGLSRERHRIFLYGELAAKYGGLLK